MIKTSHYPKESRNCLMCGSAFMASTHPSRDGRGRFCSKSCGARYNQTKHGHTTKKTQSRTYNTWTNMISRCHRPSSPRYESYGAVGIAVCDRWRNSFENFLADMGERPDGCTIDRIDGSLGYSPENCRWLSIKEQQRNRKNNVMITFDNTTMCLKDWANLLGISSSTLSYRIKHWPIERALKPTPRDVV